ncbi:aspartate/glutamate racemase family protein [Allofournierella sp.]|uniref:aspartate/glutamate racemase family protein n=1 Tax=Allofournierella sp. TaxID=1940256 RepID=UPI003AF0E946
MAFSQTGPGGAPHPVLGVLGGIGPMSTVYFYEMITAHTQAEKDQDHLDIVISSRATTPDRSAYVLGQSKEDSFSVMERDAEMLVEYGATVLAIPCNTAHYFYDRLQRSLPVPVLNMIQLTVRAAKAQGCTKLGILATSGTVASCSYQRMCAAEGLGWAVPCEADQAVLMQHIIYDEIKGGKPVDLPEFLRIADALKAAGCQRAVLGCTELSLIKRNCGLDDFFIDSTEVLAREAILACGKTPVGFNL